MHQYNTHKRRMSVSVGGGPLDDLYVDLDDHTRTDHNKLAYLLSLFN